MNAFSEIQPHSRKGYPRWTVNKEVKPSQLEPTENVKRAPLDRDSRIVGGKDADTAEWPWMVALVNSAEPNHYNGQFCGASLIHPYWVLTAAHCVEFSTPSEVDVVLGATDLNITSGTQRIPVDEIILHPDYNTFSLEYDVALLRLSVPADTSYPVLPIIDEPSLAGAGVTARVIGWGATNPDGTGFPSVLQEVDVPIVPLALANQPSSYNGTLTTNMIPAGLATGGVDSCQGDSGGPLLVPAPIEGGWVQAGIVSFGDGCAQPDLYGIYTRLSLFRDFILSYIMPDYQNFEFSQGVTGEFRDPDQDDINNWTEFAFNLNPLTSSNTQRPKVDTVMHQAEHYPSVFFQRPLQREGSEYVLMEASDLLGMWVTNSMAPLILHASTNGAVEEVLIRGTTPLVNSGDRGFMKAGVKYPPRYLNNTQRLIGYKDFATHVLSPLDGTHPDNSGRIMKEYILDVPGTGQVMYVVLRSDDVDPMLELIDVASGMVLQTYANDNAGGGDEKFTFINQPGAQYMFRVTTELGSGTQGNFMLAVYEDTQTAPAITIPQTVNGSLSTTDEVKDLLLPLVFYEDLYRLPVFSSNQEVQMTLDSTAFDAFLSVYDLETGREVTFNDDSIGFDAGIGFFAQANIQYGVGISSSFATETGTYSFSIAYPPTPVNLAIPQTRSSTLNNNDGLDYIYLGPYSTYFKEDYRVIGGAPGQWVQVTMSSTVVDPYLILINEDTGEELYWDDNSGGGTTAQFWFQLEAGVNHLIRATTFNPGEQGSYSISVQ